MTQHPEHIAIIMDGNRRWAKERGLAPYHGHEQGALKVEEIAEAAHDNGVKWLTLFAFSTENWRRSPLEIRTLMTIFRHYLKAKVQNLINRNIRLRVVGDRSRFPADINTMIDDAVARSAGNDGLNLTIALGYGGKADIAMASRAIAEKLRAGEIDPVEINEDMIKAHLSTAMLPPVDLLIRSGREHRISNFLIWDLAYAELAFSPTHWPDFSPEELTRIIGEYSQGERRFGGDPAEPAQFRKTGSST
ncbi:MAG: polyprenyl diphosphate synthase [Candidatus Puniceispirillales bacterium]